MLTYLLRIIIDIKFVKFPTPPVSAYVNAISAAILVKPGTDVSVIKEGDIIYYDKSAGHDMLIEDNPYTVITERDVVVVL